MKANHRIRVVLVCASLVVGLAGAAFGALYGWIQWDARRKARAVWAAYPQAPDAVTALILRVQSQDCPLPQRNRAVWMLGRLADARALETLNKMVTGRPCDHDLYLCQYELQKAIRRCGGQPEGRRSTKLSTVKPQPPKNRCF